MSIIMLKKKRIAFPVFGEPQAVGDSPAKAWGGRLIIEPDDPQIADIEKAMKEVAKVQWKDDWESVYNLIVEDKRTAFLRAPYKNKKTGKVYAGFEGNYSLGMRWSADKAGRPTVVSKTGVELTENTDRDRAIYSGCYVNAKVEFWAQDNSYGRRVNCTPLGVMFAEDGPSFGGGAAPASADDFEEYVKAGEDSIL
jgi:hypothetical protein